MSEITIRKVSNKIRTALYIAKQKPYIINESKGNGGQEEWSHVTYCSVWNSGDTVLSQCVRRAFMNEEEIKKWNLISVSKTPTERDINRINDTAKVIIGGGGLFLPDTNANSVSGWQWAISQKQLGEIKVPLCVFSVGYNYFRGQTPTELFIDNINALVERADFFGLRNMGSVRAVRSLLKNGKENKVVYQPCTTTLIRKLYPNIPSKNKSNNVAINVAFDREKMRYGEHKDQILSQIATGMKIIEKKGYNIFCVLHCSSDDKFLPYLDNANVNYKIADLSREYPNKTFSFYNNMDTVFGMRGHAQMIPFGLNCEIISLGSHDKLRWFLEDIEAPDWYIELNSDPRNIADLMLHKFEEIHENNRDITREHLIFQQDKLWSITTRNIEIISNL